MLYIRKNISQSLKKLFNFSSGESEGKINIFKYIPPEFQNLVKKNIALRLKGENIPSYELNLFLPENNEIFVRVHNNLITFNGKPAIMGVLQDITELKKLEPLTDNADFRNAWMAIKQKNKVEFSRRLQKWDTITINP